MSSTSSTSDGDFCVVAKVNTIRGHQEIPSWRLLASHAIINMETCESWITAINNIVVQNQQNALCGFGNDMIVKWLRFQVLGTASTGKWGNYCTLIASQRESDDVKLTFIGCSCQNRLGASLSLRRERAREESFVWGTIRAARRVKSLVSPKWADQLL